MVKPFAIHSSFPLSAILLSFLTASIPMSSHAATPEEIEASAQYVLGDNDSKLDGRRLALQEAKRNALEKAGTYIESFTEVKNFQLTQDQVRSYAAGILELKEAGEKWDRIGDNLSVTLTVKVKVDKDVVAKQLVALRKNSEAAQALEEARRKIQEYEQKIAEMNKDLKMAKGSSAESTKESRSKALTGIDVETLLAKANLAFSGSEDEMAVTVAGSTSASGRQRARVFAEEAFKLSPDNPKVLTMLGSIDFEESSYNRAEERFREALRIKPDHFAAHNDLGMVLSRQGRTPEAIQEYREAIRLRPDFAETHHNLGAALWKQGDRAEAVKEMKETVRLKPDHYFAHYNLARLLRAIDDDAGARLEFQEACRLGYAPACSRATAGCATAASAADSGLVAQTEDGLDVELLMLLAAPLMFALRRLPSMYHQ